MPLHSPSVSAPLLCCANNRNSWREAVYLDIHLSAGNMARVARFSMLLCLYICLSINGYANIIESLSTKENVKKFLAAHLSQAGLYHHYRAADISQTEKSKMIMSGFDTFMVDDPITGGLIMKSVPKEPHELPIFKSNAGPFYFPFENVFDK